MSSGRQKECLLRNELLPQQHNPNITHAARSVSTAKRVARLAPFRAAGFQVKAALAAPSLDWLTLMQVGRCLLGNGKKTQLRLHPLHWCRWADALRNGKSIPQAASIDLPLMA